MRVYTNNQLKRYISNELKNLELEGVRRSRFCKTDLDNFLQNASSKICGVYGLRRTGKTTLIYQTIQEMDCNNVCFIRCNNGDHYIDIENLLDTLPQKYIFIDEITKADGFIQLSSSLYENYPDKKIVIAGTDSASLLFAKEDELYDRIELIHTTYISFSEFNYLLGKSLEEYIQYGGTLTDGIRIYNNEDNLEDYTNTAIVSNICRSVEAGKDNIQYKRLYTLYLSGELEAAINKTIEINAKEFSLRVLNNIFLKSHNFGSAKDLVLKANIPMEDKKIIADWKDHKEICEFIAKELQMNSLSNIQSEDIGLITNFLIKLDVLSKKSNGEIFFTQSGMQYCFAKIIIDNIVNTVQFQKLFPETQKVFLEKIHQDAVGHILENIIQADIKKCPIISNMEIGKIDNIGAGEFDLYIINPRTKKAIVYEIKRSSIVAPNQYQHLLNEKFCNAFEEKYRCRIIQKTVLYQGESKYLNNGITYYNASEFLLHLQDFILPFLENKSDLINENELDTNNDFGVEMK